MAANLVYRYDGSLQGFLCCVAQSFFDKAVPAGIGAWDDPQATLFPIKEVETDWQLAKRLERSITSRISPEAWDMVQRGFLTCMEEKELRLLRFILLGYKMGPRVARLSTNEDVHALDKALLYLKNEAHYHVEFLRFTDFGGFLGAVITPNNTVLPLIVHHFCSRLNTEDFMIYEKTHQMGFLHRKGGAHQFFQADHIQFPEKTDMEKRCQALWRIYYDAAAVEGRENPKLRRGHMPMRYWVNMTEFQRG